MIFTSAPGERFQFDVFLSHNQADKPRVRRLAERLRAAGLRVRFDEWIIQPGDSFALPAGLERSPALFRGPANGGRRVREQLEPLVCFAFDSDSESGNLASTAPSWPSALG